MSTPRVKGPGKGLAYRSRDSATANERAEETRPMITVRELTMGWGEKILQENASFDVPRGSTFGILGGSGCGKSSVSVESRNTSARCVSSCRFIWCWRRKFGSSSQ